jgi:plastocyanin
MLRNSKCVTLSFLSFLALAASSRAVDHQIVVQTAAFAPEVMNIEVGDKVIWTNSSGVAHNVVALDGSFNSGPLSSDAWVFSLTFRRGGTFTYRSQAPGAIFGTINVAGVYADGFEVGSTQGWDDSQPSFIACTCYFSNDCPSNANFCNWGVLSTEDNCEWMEVKPEGVPGAGCNVLYQGVGWVPNICDGVCEPSRRGSIPGSEDPAKVREAVLLWADAIIGPAIKRGGGPVDPVIAGKVLNLGFKHQESAMMIGRQVADLLMLGGNPGFYGHFCHFEGHPDEPDPSKWVDLSAERCKAAMARKLADSLAAELSSPGAGAVVLRSLPPTCTWSDIGPTQRCHGDLACLGERVQHMAIFLSTPPNRDSLFFQESFFKP